MTASSESSYLGVPPKLGRGATPKSWTYYADHAGRTIYFTRIKTTSALGEILRATAALRLI